MDETDWKQICDGIDISNDLKQWFNTELDRIVYFSYATENIKEKLSHFEQKAKVALKGNEFIDIELFNELKYQCDRLIELCEENPKELFVPFALAAVAYFIKEDDARRDFDGIEGFEDDKEVIEAVISKFQLTERIAKRA